jgi:hypothetical protein
VNGLLILLRFLGFFFRNCRVFPSGRSRALAALWLTAVTSVPLNRAASHTLGITVTSASAVTTSHTASINTTTIIKFIATSTGVTTSAVQALALVFASVWVSGAGTVKVTVSATITVSIATVTRWGDAADLAVGSFAISLCLATVCFVCIHFRGAVALPAGASSFSTSTAVFTVATVVVPPTSTGLSVCFAILLCILVSFFQAANSFFKGRFPKLIGLQGLVFFVFLKTRLDFSPGVGYPDRRLQALDARTQCVHGATLLTIGGMLLILCATDRLFLDTLEDEAEDIRVDLGGAAVGGHDRIEFLECCISRNFISFVLKSVR